jgi:hypothetical protein
MKCENCNAHNAHAIIIDDRYVLCPRCLKILEELNQEYKDIVGVVFTTGIQQSDSFLANAK